MKAALLGCCIWGIASGAFAHRLDEYLQAARIALTTNGIDLAFELTPGVAVAARVIELTDPDRDGRVSSDEANRYARRFLKELWIGLDGKATALSVTTVSFPSVQEFRNGTGVIRIRAASETSPLGAGRHVLSLTNSHLPAISVYMVNALQTKDPAVEIGKQTRDELQRTYQLEFRVRAPAP